MPIWHDPFDELIADLERSVPTAAAPDFDMPPPMEDHCFWAARAILAHEPFEALRRADDPRVRRVQGFYDRWAERRSRADGSPTPEGG
jgi:hypothetical protein